MTEVDLLIRAGYEDIPGPLRPLAIDLQAPDRCCRCGGKLIRKGRQKSDGKQRLVCRQCGKHYTDNRHVAGAYVTPPQMSYLAQLYLDGETASRAAKHLGLWHRSVARVFRTFRKVVETPNCPCGRKATHPGSCSYRRQHPKRNIRRQNKI